MVLHLDIPTSAVTALSMLVLGLSLFRISIKNKWLHLLFASLLLSCLYFTIAILKIPSFGPMLHVATQAVFIHYIFRIRKFHSLMIAFLGSLGYTLYLAVILFLAPLLTDASLSDYFYNNDLASRALKIMAASLSYLTGYVLVKRRLGFTVRMEMRDSTSWRPHNQALFIVSVFSLVLFFATYYAVTLKLSSIFYFAAGFCLLLVIIFFLLYRKEMEEN
ncbi:hypothetical protein [Paenibacillus sp. N3.4]|uniref:hypothetical protein n=1 Tax=Paenibacillus sp. N3.4 TaxID=2603222 RepID=UPI0011C92F11|nr:hypothetical protein [Paenibacillus sp. N3.4]TXK73397.1 hypothetical protein FU659_30830 [Paenibacillus sp. N3.4]